MDHTFTAGVAVVANIDDEIKNFPGVLVDQIKAAQAVWRKVEIAIDKSPRVLLWGPPGTGKSYAGAVSSTGEVYEKLSRVYLTLDTPASEIRGHYIPCESGGFRWHHGPASRAWVDGGRLVIDEIDSASGDALTLLLGYLDDERSARITLPSNETIRPQPGFAVVATTNQVPTSLPEALLDRFDVVQFVGFPNPAAFFRASWHSTAIRNAAISTTYIADPKARPRGAGGRAIGLRSFLAIDRLVGNGLDVNEASRLVLGDDVGGWLDAALKIGTATE